MTATTGPVWPLAACWSWTATTFWILETVTLYSRVAWSALSCRVAWPWADVARAGTDSSPVRWALKVVVRANAGAAATAIRVTTARLI
jgi:putative intracellular protease/amidase